MKPIQEFRSAFTILDDKWLDFYELNSYWMLGVGLKYNDDYLNRFALGVLSVIEPNLTGYLELFSSLNSDPKRLTKVFFITIENITTKIEERKAEREALNAQNNQDISENKTNCNEIQEPKIIKSIEEFYSNFQGLDDKWLNFYELNSLWIEQLNLRKNTDEIDEFALGVLCAMEPNLGGHLNLFSWLNNNPTKLTEILKITTENIDEKIQERKLAREKNKSENALNRDQYGNIIDHDYEIVSQYLDEIRAQIRQQENSS